MKKIWIWVAAGLAILALLLFVLFTVLGSKVTVIETKGSATVTRGAKSINAKPDLKLKQGDVLTTGKSGSLWFRLDKSKSVLLDELSTMRLESIGKNIALAFESGAALIRNDKSLSQKESFQIQVGNVTIRVQDACVFSIHLDASNQLTLNVYQGEVTVYGPDDTPLITLKKGLSVQLDTDAAALSGEAQPIDYSALSPFMLDNVMDYAKEAGYVTVSDAAAAPPEDAPSEPEDAEAATAGQTSTPPESQESAADGEAPLLPNAPDVPVAAYKYMWNGKAFKPYVSIAWTDSRAAYIEWQLCDSSGNAIGAGGRFDAAAGGVNFKDSVFDISPPNGANLYPMDYAIRLTPYYVPAQGESGIAMPSIALELPYFKVEAERSGTQLLPVISTNIGLYFEHSYEALTDRTENGRLRVTGSLMPLAGEQVALKLDVLSE